MKKFVFNFNSKESKKLKNSKNILGGKGANLAEMGKLDDLCLALSLDLNSTYEYERFEA